MKFRKKPKSFKGYAMYNKEDGRIYGYCGIVQVFPTYRECRYSLEEFDRKEDKVVHVEIKEIKK